MPNDFETQLDKLVINTEARLLAVTTQSIQETVLEMQTPVEKGGKMRVKTGFLRSSGLASLNSPPAGATMGEKDGSYVWSTSYLNVILSQMKIGDIFYFGWTAEYARKREIFDGFMVSALGNWQKKVDKAVTFYRNKDKI